MQAKGRSAAKASKYKNKLHGAVSVKMIVAGPLLVYLVWLDELEDCTICFGILPLARFAKGYRKSIVLFIRQSPFLHGTVLCCTVTVRCQSCQRQTRICWCACYRIHTVAPDLSFSTGKLPLYLMNNNNDHLQQKNHIIVRNFSSTMALSLLNYFVFDVKVCSSINPFSLCLME